MFSWNPKGYKNFNATLKGVWSHCVCSVKTTTPIIFDHTHAHSKTLRAAEETSREEGEEEKKNTKQKLCKIQKKSFLELSHILIMIDNESQKKTHWQKKWNASSWKTWFSLVRCYYYWLSNIFSRLLTNKQTNKQTFVHCLPYYEKTEKNVKSLKKRAFDFFVEFVLLCCLLSFLRPLKVKKKKPSCASSNLFW